MHKHRIKRVLVICCVVIPLTLVSIPLSIRTYMSQVYLRHGVEAFNAGSFDDADKLCSRAAELSPCDYVPYYYLGKARVSAGNYQGAVEALRKASRRNPNHFPTLLILGCTYLKLDSPEQARRHLRKALDLAPERAETLHYMGICENRLGAWEEARRYFQKALPTASQNQADVYSNLALASLQLGDRDGALAYLGRALEQQSDDPAYYLRAGTIFCELGKYEAAVHMLEKALKLFDHKGIGPSSEPDVLKAQYLLASVRLQAQNDPGACSKTVLELSQVLPRDPLVVKLTDLLFEHLTQTGFPPTGSGNDWYRLITALVLQERHNEAAASFVAASEKGLKDTRLLTVACQNICKALLSDGDYERALEVVDKGLAMSPDCSPLRKLKMTIAAMKMTAAPAGNS